MNTAYASGVARREARVALLLVLMMTCVAALWPSSAQAASITYKGEWSTGLSLTMKFSKKNGTLKLQSYRTQQDPPFEQLYVATCDGGETTRWSPPSGFAGVKVNNGEFVQKTKGSNQPLGAGSNTTKLTGTIKGKRVEGKFTWKNFGNGTQTGCNGQATYTATR